MVERTVNDDNPELGNCLIDLDTGKVLSPANDLKLEDVVQIWSDHQTATKTVRFHWVETRFHWVETRKTGVKHDCVLWLGDGPHVRSESIPIRDSTVRNDSLTRAGLAVSAFNGKRNSYYTAATGPNDHHRGILFDAKVYDELVNYNLRAVILCYRPMLVVRSQWSANKDGIVEHDATLRIVEHDAMFSGRRCVVVESTSDAPGNITDRYWVDVSRGGLILKHVQASRERVAARLTIEYNITPDLGWVPASWNARFERQTATQAGFRSQLESM